MKPKEISFALRTSIGNHSRIMYILKDLVRKRAKLSTARNISKWLNDDYTAFGKYTHNLRTVRLAVNAIKQYIHPTRDIPARRGRRTQAHVKHR